jgi:hypothetical protein
MQVKTGIAGCVPRRRLIIADVFFCQRKSHPLPAWLACVEKIAGLLFFS